MTTPVLPPIKKQYQLNSDRAISRVTKNILFCQDNGLTSEAFKAITNSLEEEVQFSLCTLN